MKTVLLCVAAIGVMGGYMLGVGYPPCCPGEQRSCYPEGSGHLGITYCRKSGFGWEMCQAFTGEYPQALWRSE